MGIEDYSTTQGDQMDKILKEIAEVETAILMWVQPSQHRDAVAEGIVDLRRLYSNVCEIIAGTKAGE